MTKCSTVTVKASSQSPAPAAVPIAAVSHTLAAVVSPRTVLRRVRISPAPRKLMPDTMPAATREGSKLTWSPMTSLKPYLLTSTNSAEAVPTIAWVRRPALRPRRRRSSPMRVLRTNASRSRAICSVPCPAKVSVAR